MIQLKLSKTGQYEITDRKVAVNLGQQTVTIGDQAFTETGEYEVSGVEVIFGSSAALIVWEQLHVVYLFGQEAPTAFERAQFSSCDVILIDKEIAALKKDLFEQLLDAFDPKILIISNSTTVEATSKDALQIQDTPLLKITTQTLPAEGRDFYRLT